MAVSYEFSLESVTIGPETTAPVVTNVDPLTAQAVTAKGRQKLSDRATLALKALSETILTHGQAAPISLGLPAGIRTVTVAQWREEMFRLSVIARNHKNHCLWRSQIENAADQGEGNICDGVTFAKGDRTSLH
jgi:hypothetical protein